MFKYLETKYKILFIIILVIIIIPVIMWISTMIHDGIVHFFGGKTKDDIIAEQKVSLNKLEDVKTNNEKTIKLIKKKNQLDVKLVTEADEKINNISYKLIKKIKEVNDPSVKEYKRYKIATAISVHDKNVLTVNPKQPTVKVVKKVVVKHIENTTLTKKITTSSYIIDKRKYEIEGYKNITLIWDTYKEVKDKK